MKHVAPNTICVALLFSSFLLFTSCGKKSVSRPESSTPAPTAPAAAKATDAIAGSAEIDYSKTLDRLTQAVRKYAAEMRTAPKSLEEVAAAGYLPESPVAPPGKKYVIDDQLRVRIK